MLAPTPTALLIGTDRAIHAYDGENLTEQASYGVVPGWCWARDDDEGGESMGVYIWTQRGLCKAMPFTNLTSGHLSVAPGHPGRRGCHRAGRTAPIHRVPAPGRHGIQPTVTRSTTMTIRLSTGARNGPAGRSGFAAMFNHGYIKVFSGAQPANADAAETGTPVGDLHQELRP